MASFRDLFDLGLPDIVENDTNKTGNNYCIGYQEMNELAVNKGTNKSTAHLIIGVKDPSNNYKSAYDPATATFNKRYSHDKLKEIDTLPVGTNYTPEYDLIDLEVFKFRTNTTYLLLQKDTDEQKGIYITDPIMITYPYNE